ncbi:helix-turn-helix domain protein [Shigella dysenteriae 225-75]|nr:helix-turn-helix domain protein [Shigella dysenteriae 225-75]
MTNSISRKLSSAMLLQNKNSAINNRLRTQREACGLTEVVNKNWPPS